jgi:hypothetical protein
VVALAPHGIAGGIGRLGERLRRRKESAVSGRRASSSRTDTGS